MITYFKWTSRKVAGILSFYNTQICFAIAFAELLILCHCTNMDVVHVGRIHQENLINKRKKERFKSHVLRLPNVRKRVILAEKHLQV